MKKLFQKILVVGLFALTQVAFMAAANAGSFLRCKGDVIPTSDPTILVSAYASNEAGETVAVVTTSFLADGRLKHVIDSLVDDSYLMATAAPDINHSVSLDDARASFPEELKGAGTTQKNHQNPRCFPALPQASLCLDPRERDATEAQ